MNLSHFDSSFLAICHLNSIYFSSTRVAELVDARVVYGIEDTADLKGIES